MRASTLSASCFCRLPCGRWAERDLCGNNHCNSHSTITKLLAVHHQQRPHHVTGATAAAAAAAAVATTVAALKHATATILAAVAALAAAAKMARQARRGNLHEVWCALKGIRKRRYSQEGYVPIVVKAVVTGLLVKLARTWRAITT